MVPTLSSYTVTDAGRSLLSCKLLPHKKHTATEGNKVTPKGLLDGVASNSKNRLLSSKYTEISISSKS